VGLYRDEAVVLRSYKLGEADRIIVLLTAERGKVRAVAKGVRRTKSRFGARLEPPSRVSLLGYEGRNLDGINQVETVEAYAPLRRDLDRMTDAGALVEAAEQVGREGESDPGLFKMLTGALRTLAYSPHRPALLVGAFYWKLLVAEGVVPVVEHCVACGEPEVVSFDVAAGGTLCRAHRQGVPVDVATLAVVRQVLGGRLTEALALPGSPEVFAAAGMATAALEAHLERRLKVVHLLGGSS